MFCTKCGKEADENARFCKYCGTPIYIDPEDDEDYSEDDMMIPDYVDDPGQARPMPEVRYIQEVHVRRDEHPGDSSSGGYAVLSFFLPLIGFILWLAWKPTYPKRAHSCIVGTLIGVAMNIIFGRYIAATILGVLLTWR